MLEDLVGESLGLHPAGVPAYACPPSKPHKWAVEAHSWVSRLGQLACCSLKVLRQLISFSLKDSGLTFRFISVILSDHLSNPVCGLI